MCLAGAEPLGVKGPRRGDDANRSRTARREPQGGQPGECYERPAKVAHSSRGVWRIAASPSLLRALSNAVLRRWGFVMPSDLAAAIGTSVREGFAFSMRAVQEQSAVKP